MSVGLRCPRWRLHLRPNDRRLARGLLRGPESILFGSDGIRGANLINTKSDWQRIALHQVILICPLFRGGLNSLRYPARRSAWHAGLLRKIDLPQGKLRFLPHGRIGFTDMWPFAANLREQGSVRCPQTVGIFVGSSRLDILVSACIESCDYLTVPTSCK
jgi:hypothetical protein